MIGVLSFICTLLTYFIVMRSLGGHTHYSDASIPYVKSYTKVLGDRLLSLQYKTQLDKRMAAVKATYQVMNISGVPLYGSYKKRLFFSSSAVLNNLNVKNTQQAGSFPKVSATTLIPITNAQGNLAGALYFSWKTPMSSLYGFPPIVVYSVLTLLILTPFLYIGLFTYLFARWISKNINQPVQALIRAARKIQMRDLNFHIEYHDHHEIGELLRAFEEMRSDLHDALVKQWALEDERRDMLQAISHDLRTPATIIQGHAEMLEEMDDAPDIVKRYASAIVRNTSRIIRLLADFKTVTDLEGAQFSLHPSPILLPEFFLEKLAEYNALAESQGKQMEQQVATHDAFNQTVWVDVDRLAQIMDNIMANALRYTPQGGCLTWNIVIESDVATLSLHDSGPGFNPHDIIKVSRKFYRSDAAQTDAAFHAGLGLYIAKELTERHHGQLILYNHPEGGAVVELSIRFFAEHD